MDKPERGQRAEIGIYDDACSFTDEEMKLYWEMLSKDGIDTGINIFHDRLRIESKERRNQLIDAINSLGCTSFTITSEQIKSRLNKKDDD